MQDSQGPIPYEVINIKTQYHVSLIRAWREHLGMSQKEVADRAGIAKSTFANIENEIGNPRQSTLEKIAAAMGIKIDQLV